MHLPEDLLRHYRSGRLIPFVGAGVSMSVTWLDQDGVSLTGFSWSQMVDQACRMLGFDEPALLRSRGGDLQVLEYFRLKKPLQELTNWMVRNMNPPDCALQESAIHRQLATMEFPLIYTTNYDDFLERAIRLHGKQVRRIVHERDLCEPPADVDVVKFHGDFETPSAMVVSEQDYERRLKLESDLDYRLRADALGKSFLFLGYSFSDANVAYIFRRMNETFQRLPGSSSGRRAYVVVPEPSEFERVLFQERNMDVVPIDFEDLASGVVKVLDLLKGN